MRTMDLNIFLQNFIYLINEPNIRNNIINKNIKTNTLITSQSNTKWSGTLFVVGDKNNLFLTKYNSKEYNNTPLTTFFQRNKKKFFTNSKNEKILFTVCYSYTNYKVHFVSFIYQNNTLIHFDPGVSLYNHGQKTIVPSIANIYKNVYKVNKNFELGKCNYFKYKKRKMGIQFNDNNTIFPADAFCQSWTLFFLIRATIADEYSFIENWCQIKPSQREIFLISNFILPFLYNNPSYHNKIIKNSNLPSKNYLNDLFYYIEKNFI